MNCFLAVTVVLKNNDAVWIYIYSRAYAKHNRDEKSRCVVIEQVERGGWIRKTMKKLS